LHIFNELNSFGNATVYFLPLMPGIELLKSCRP
jgi:hypothetical protein